MPYRPIVYPEQYGPGKGTVAGYYHRTPDTSQTADEHPTSPALIVIVYGDRYITPAHVQQLYLSQPGVESEAAAPAAPQVEGGPAFIGRHQPGHHNAAAYRYIFNRDPDFNITFEPFVPPQVSTDKIGRYKPTSHVIARHLLFNRDIDFAPFFAQVEPAASPADRIGKHVPAKHNVVRHLLFPPDTSQSGPVGESAIPGDIRVLPYADQQIRPAHLHAYLHAGNSDPTAPDVEAERTHYPVTWRAQKLRDEWTTPTYGLLSGQGFQGDPAETQQPGQHFIPKHQPGRHRVLPLLRFGSDLSGAVEFPTQPETNTFVIGRHRAGQHKVNPALRLQPDTSASAPVEEQQPANPSTLGRHQPGRHKIVPGLIFSAEATGQGGAEESTATSRPAQPRQVRYRVATHLLFGGDTSTPEAAAQPDTWQSWRPEPLQDRYRSKVAAGLLYGQPDTSFSNPEASTVPRWRAQRLPNQWFILQASRLLYGQPDTSASAPAVPAPTAVRKNYRLWMRRLELENIR